MGGLRYVAVAALVVIAAGCGDETEEGQTGADTGGASSDTTAGMDDAVDGSPCDLECDDPPGECYDSGACVDGTCEYVPALAGTTCEEGCDDQGYCDAGGMCICASGGCEETCTATEHSTAMCDEGGECVRTCEAPWENCDGDWANGCEIPVGITGVCDANGMNMEGGCWTAYCGASDGAEAHNFGSYYCVDCSTCNVPGAGMCRWCNRDAGTWYPAEACSCDAAFLDLACNP